MRDNFGSKAALLDPGRTRTIGNYVIGKTLGKGTFGKVKAAIHVPTGEKVAIKILEKEKIIDVADVERVSREIHILKLIRHPSIIQLYQIIETPKQLFLIMEYMECGQLFDYIVKCKKVPEEEACMIFQQIVGGIEYIHKLNIVHRDLKPENLLIDYDRTVRIVDFGLSNTYRKGIKYTTQDERLKTACGSPCYAAPEMIEGKNRYEAIMVDIWSCGVILYAMLCGCLPFEDPQTSKLYQKILSGEYKVPRTLSDEAKDLLGKILTVDPLKRYRIDDIRRHRWWNISPPQNTSSGIIVGYHRIPVDSSVLDATVNLGFELDFTKKCIEANRHNDATTTYYLLLKKFVRQGGISKSYLGSKHFDATLIEPLRKTVAPNSMFEQTASAFNEKGSNDRNINSQPGITRKTYYVPSNNSLDRRGKQRENIRGPEISKYRRLTNATDKLGNSLRVRQQRTISLERGSDGPGRNNLTIGYDSRHESISRNEPTGNHNSNSDQVHRESAIERNSAVDRGNDVVSRTNDAINRKYKQTYGISLISKSKERSQSRRRSLKNYELSEIYEKSQMNQTIVGYSRGKKVGKTNRIGIDKGFDNPSTIDSATRKPYLNRRFVYH